MNKRIKLIYLTSTLWLALGMLVTGAGHLAGMAKGQGGTEMMERLGYPVHLLTLLGIWKILGVIAIFMPGSPRLKEWAYAGFSFLTTGAIFSHIASGDSVTAIFPAMLLLVLTALSWYFRPAEKKPIAADI